MQTLPLLAAALLAVVHFNAGRLRFLDRVPRSRWLSAAGGISVAYVVVHLLPELAEFQEAIGEAAPAVVASIERHAYLFALVGLAVFYGVELHSRATRRRLGRPDAGATAFAFASYAAYNGVIGYLLARRADGLVLFAVAMGLHFLVNDHGLRTHHEHAYHRWGRWLVSAAVVAGAGLGVLVEVPEAMIGVLFAFIAGGTILNVLKEELPEERQSHFGAFVAGAAGYTVVLLAL